MIRNKYLLLFILLILALVARTQHAFRYDNTIYKAVYLNEAFRLMDSAANYLLLDVRTAGEYADTSHSTALNIGRIRGATNINIDDVPAHLSDLKKYSDQPVFVYCSHSQRSRRVSKLLAENGFRNVYNINGGMSLINEMDVARFPWKNKVIEVNTSYKNIASTDAAALIKNTRGLVIIDIRTRAEFDSKDTSGENNIGHLRNAINIPQSEFAEKLGDYKISADKTILLYDLYGYNSMDVVDYLRAKGITRIYNLFEGLAAFACDHAIDEKFRHDVITGEKAYNKVDPETAISVLRKYPNAVIIDTRPPDEFENKSKVTYHNLGHLKGAVNISSPAALESFMTKTGKSARILVCPGMGNQFAFKACDALVRNGFNNVNFLSQGLYRFVWATANIEDCRTGREFLVDHEGLY